MSETFAPNERSRIRRLQQIGSHDKARIFHVLDSSLVCHVGYVIDGQPYVTPTSFWRIGERLYWHGSSASRMLRSQMEGLPVCLSVVHLDGIVVARSGFNSSINYRSVMAFGMASEIADGPERLAALDAFVERLLPGHGREFRPPHPQEIKATAVIAMTIEEASLKESTGPPNDEPEDYAFPVWAGVVPVSQVIGPAEADPRLIPGTDLPQALRAYHPGEKLDDVLRAIHPERRLSRE